MRDDREAVVVAACKLTGAFVLSDPTADDERVSYF